MRKFIIFLVLVIVGLRVSGQEVYMQPKQKAPDSNMVAVSNASRWAVWKKLVDVGVGSSDSLQYDAKGDSLNLRDGKGVYYAPRIILAGDQYNYCNQVPDPRVYDIFVAYDTTYYYTGDIWLEIDTDKHRTNEGNIFFDSIGVNIVGLRSNTNPMAENPIKGLDGIKVRYNPTITALEIRPDTTKLVTPYDLTQIPNPRDSTNLNSGYGTYVYEVSPNNWNVEADTSEVVTPFDLNKMVADSSYWKPNSTHIYNKNSGNVGIKSTNPIAPLHVGNNNTTSVDPQILVSRNVDNSVSGNGHAFVDGSVIDRSGGVAYNSYDSGVLFSGSNNYDHYAIFQNGMSYSSSGTMTNMYGFVNNPTVTAGTVTNNYGIRTGILASGGTITNNYGVSVVNPTGGGTVTNNYGIKIENLTKGATKNMPIRIDAGDGEGTSYILEAERGSGYGGFTMRNYYGSGIWGVKFGKMAVYTENTLLNLEFANNRIGINTDSPAKTLHITGGARITELDTDLTAPATSGTTKMVISDANGDLSFAAIPAGSATIDSTVVQNSYGTIITETPANTFNIKVDSSKFATTYDLTLNDNQTLTADSTSTTIGITVSNSNSRVHYTVDRSATNEIEVVDEAYNATNFNGSTASGVSQDDLYDYLHTADTDDDGKIEKVDLSSAGFIKSDVSGNLSVDANTYITGNQSISLSGDVSGTGATAITTTIAADAVSNVKMANMAANTMKANATAGSENPADLAIAANTFPARSSTGNIAAKSITDFAFTILDDATAADVRSTIGAGTGNGNGTVTGSGTINQLAKWTSNTSIGALIGTGYLKGNGSALTWDNSTFMTTSLLSGKIWVGNAGDNASAVTMSGDATLDNLGALTIGNDKITESKLKAVDTPADEEYLTYESTTGDFEWQTLPAASVARAHRKTEWTSTGGSYTKIDIDSLTFNTGYLTVSLTNNDITIGSGGAGYYEITLNTYCNSAASSYALFSLYKNETAINPQIAQTVGTSTYAAVSISDIIYVSAADKLSWRVIGDYSNTIKLQKTSINCKKL